MIMFFCSKEKHKGFTLLELTIVIVSIGILASIAIPRFFGAIKMARETEARAILISIRSAQLRYYLEQDGYTTTIGSLDLDLTANPTDYYTYSALDGTIGVGQAAADQGFALTNFRIAEDGTLSSY